MFADVGMVARNVFCAVGIGVETRGVKEGAFGSGTTDVGAVNLAWTFWADDGGGEARRSLGNTACFRHSLTRIS